MIGVFAKLAIYAAVLGAAGFSFAALGVTTAPQSVRRYLGAASLLSIVAAATAGLRILLDAVRLAGDWAAVGEPPYLSWAFDAQSGFIAAFAPGAIILFTAGLARWRVAAAIGGAVMLASFAATGHASADGAPWPARAALVVHLWGVAFWVAAPIVLWPAAWTDHAELLDRMKRFSRIATLIVPASLAAGAVLVVTLLPQLTNLVTTTYGRLIALKVVLAASAFGLGAINKVWVTQRLEINPVHGRRLLKLTLSADAILFAVALTAVAAATTLTGPTEEL